jgi:hypothetical protein
MKIAKTDSVAYHDGTVRYLVQLLWNGPNIHAQMVEMTDWCLDNFGIDHDRNWFCKDNVFNFSSEEQQILFVMRWS